MIPQSLLAFFYQTVIWVTDVVQTCVGPARRLPERDGSQIDALTDEDLLEPCRLVTSIELFPTRGVNRLTPDVIFKMVPTDLLTDAPADEDWCMRWPQEAMAHELISSRTNIPVPPIRRVLSLDPDISVIFMDHIPGVTLAEAWPTMGLWQKLRTAWTLRSYVRQLRSIAHPRSHIPGPVLEGDTPGPCLASVIFGPMNPVKGPFASSAEFIKFFNHRMDKVARAGRCVHKGPLKDDGKLVYSHVDIAPRNLIVGDDGQLWMIDFATAGFYPRWFEYVNLVMESRIESGREYDAVWRAIIPFIADPYFTICDWVLTIAPGGL